MNLVDERRGTSTPIPNVKVPIVHGQTNGDFSLTFEVAKEHNDSVFWERGDIISAKTPKGYDYFYVDEIVKTGRNIETHCLHKSFLLQYKLHDDLGVIHDTTSVDNILNRETLDNDSDILIRYRGRYQLIGEHYGKDSVYNTLLNGQNSILSMTGTKLYRHRNLVELRDDYGKDTGLILHDRRNIKDINFSDHDEIITKLYLSTTVNEWEALPKKEGLDPSEERPFLPGIFTPPKGQSGMVNFRVRNATNDKYIEDQSVQIRVVDSDGNMVIHNAQTGSYKAVQLKNDRVKKATDRLNNSRDKLEKAQERLKDAQASSGKTKQDRINRANADIAKYNKEISDNQKELDEVSSQEIILGQRYFDTFKIGTYYAQIVGKPSGYIPVREPVKFEVTDLGYVNVELEMYPDDPNFQGKDELYRKAVVESPLINKYPHVRAEFIDVNNPNIITEEDLIAFGEELFEKERIDLPEPSLTFDISREFGHMADWYKSVQLSDKAYVNYSDYGIKDMVELVEYQFDPLRSIYISLTFGKPEHGSDSIGRGGRSGSSSSGGDKFYRDMIDETANDYSKELQLYTDMFMKQFEDEYWEHTNFINSELDKAIAKGYELELNLSNEIDLTLRDANTAIEESLRPTYERIAELEEISKELPPIDFDEIDDKTQRWIDDLINAGNISTDNIGDLDSRLEALEITIADDFGVKIQPYSEKISILEQSAESIELIVSDLQDKVSAGIQVDTEQLNAYVKSDDFHSAFQMNDRLIRLIANEVNLDGLVTFTDLESVDTKTQIHGGNIINHTITSNQIEAYSINSTRLQSDTIYSRHITSRAVTAGHLAVGTITSDHITSRGLDVGVISGLDAKIERITSNVINSEVVNTGTLNSVTINGGNISGIIMTSSLLRSSDWESFFDLETGAIGIGVRGRYKTYPNWISSRFNDTRYQTHNFQIIPHSDGTNRQNVDLTGGLRIRRPNSGIGYDTKRMDLYGNSIEFFSNSTSNEERSARLRGGHYYEVHYNYRMIDYGFQIWKYGSSNYEVRFHIGDWFGWDIVLCGNVYIDGDLRVGKTLRCGGNFAQNVSADSYEYGTTGYNRLRLRPLAIT